MSRPDLAYIDQPRRHKRKEYVPRYRLDELFEEWQLQDGLLLAKRFPKVRLGGRSCAALVAFAPQSFGTEYQALAGGSLC